MPRTLNALLAAVVLATFALTAPAAEQPADQPALVVSKEARCSFGQTRWYVSYRLANGGFGRQIVCAIPAGPGSAQLRDPLAVERAIASMERDSVVLVFVTVLHAG